MKTEPKIRKCNQGKLRNRQLCSCAPCNEWRMAQAKKHRAAAERKRGLRGLKLLETSWASFDTVAQAKAQGAVIVTQKIPSENVLQVAQRNGVPIILGEVLREAEHDR